MTTESDQGGAAASDESERDRLKSAVTDDAVSNEELERRVEQNLHGFESNFRQRHPVVWWLTLLVPVAMLVGAIIAVWSLRGWFFATKLVGAATATFFLLGRFVILLGQEGKLDSQLNFLKPWELFLMVCYMDAAAVLLVAFHVGGLFRLPWLGKRALSLVEDARFVLDRLPWMRKAAFTGLTLFVAFPLAATGAVGGSILGTLLGLGRLRVFLATVIGCLLGNGALYFAADTLGRYIDTDHWFFKFGGITVILCVILLMEYRYRKGKQKYQEEHEHPPPSEPSGRAGSVDDG